MCGELAPVEGGSRCGWRFIPACAGNSEKRKAEAAADSGSSPRVRGTCDDSNRPAAPTRFIPACAGNSTDSVPRSARSAVHPRVCGELARVEIIPANPDGSSPRVRGTRGPCDQGDAVHRFIPACAGNSPARTRPALPPTVHPRVCGELRMNHAIGRLRGGSSPRVRGTPESTRKGRRSATVHPRVCGELSCMVGWAITTCGSSPRVRGTRTAPSAWMMCRRFIPACAGNSVAMHGSHHVVSVHPRVCGELRVRRVSSIVSAGSSPRVRGTLHHHAHRVQPERFIPACAGNSFNPIVAQVHFHGSSPRVRGTRDARAESRCVSRFIPACAGNSRRRPCASRRSSVHPRVCGELNGYVAQIIRRSGSSPRVRGTPRPRRHPLG